MSHAGLSDLSIPGRAEVVNDQGEPRL